MDSKGWKNQPVTTTTSQKPLQLLSRTEWTAIEPKFVDPLEHPVTKIFLIATNRPTCYSQRSCMGELQRTQNYHMKVNTISDIRFNFIITGNGVVYEGRGWKHRPDLPHLYGKLQNKSLFIAFSGEFRDSKTIVPADMLESMDLLFKLGIDYKYISPDFETFDL